jgi:hypothetical protein
MVSDVFALAHFEKEREMDFIEQLFGIAPDGGSGSLELLLFVIPLAGVGILLLRRALKKLRHT